MSSSMLNVAGVAGFLGVAFGAFGAHGLRERFSAGAVEIYRTGSIYHLLHAVALLAIALAGDRLRWAAPISALFAAGIVIFSGSLYILAITGIGWWGAVTPIGGVAFLAGWLLLILASFLRR